MKEYLLNGVWDMRDEPLACGPDQAGRLTAETGGWIEQPVPGDIHQGLIAAGRIKEPLVGMNSFDCVWTEDRSWWLRKSFKTGRGWKSADVVELEMQGLDANAAVFLNGAALGVHINAFRPFVASVREHLREDGENVLLVRLTTGVEPFTAADLEPLKVSPGTEEGRRKERGERLRVMVRKPQYTWGWDWSPRLATTAIAGDVKIRVMQTAVIRSVHLTPAREAGDVRLDVAVTAEFFHYWKTGQGTLSVSLTDEAGKTCTARRDVLLRSGLNFLKLAIPLSSPRWWWPNGMGGQHLYTVRAELRTGRTSTALPPFSYGLRTVELDTDDTFTVRVNGVPVFCKGGNWIPPDALYARVTDAKYEALVREAAAANFNMLRVWGGGLYEREAFYSACDRHGILVWQDFMFACAPYPDHLEWFRREVELEAEYQTARLRNHACLAVWSGSNENNWGFHDWWRDQTQSGAILYNYILPRAVALHSPEIPYWNGSPYGGTDSPNSSEVGDRHHWGDCMMNAEMEKRITPEEYDRCTSLFVSEYGYIGACPRASIETYLDGAPYDVGSAVWQHHTNTFEKNTVAAGIRKHYTDPETLDLDDYILYSGLVQGLMYSYSLEAFRFRPDCHGGLFWMYNDCWGEVGWTIIDYYLRRKPSWWFVRRALAPRRLILREIGGLVHVMLANDTGARTSGTVEYGYMSFDGRIRRLTRTKFAAEPASRTLVARFRRGSEDVETGVWVARVKSAPDILPATLRLRDFRTLSAASPRLSVSVEPEGKAAWLVAVRTDRFAHAVHLDLPAGAVPEDNYFDLLPGESRKVRVASRTKLSAANVGVRCVTTPRS